MSTTTLIIIIVVILLLGGGGWYGRGRGTRRNWESSITELSFIVE